MTAAQDKDGGGGLQSWIGTLATGTAGILGALKGNSPASAPASASAMNPMYLAAFAVVGVVLLLFLSRKS